MKDNLLPDTKSRGGRPSGVAEKRPRRDRGTGSVTKDESRNRWVGTIKVDGKRIRVYAKTKVEASQLLIAATDKAKATKLLPAAPEPMTVAELVALFLERELPARRRRGKPLSVSTVEGYRWGAAVIVEHLGHVQLADLDAEMVEAMYDALASSAEETVDGKTVTVEGLSDSSIRRIGSYLIRFLDVAIGRGRVGRNVAKVAKVTSTARHPRSRKSLKPADARRLLAYLPSQRNGAMYGLMLRCGLRPGEAAGLYWEDVKGDVVNVTRAAQTNKGRTRISDDLKTNDAKRTLKIPADLAAWLERHRKAQLVERMASKRWCDEQLVFASPAGGVLSPPNVRRELAAICEAAKVPVMLPNELRHSCASLLSDMGVSNDRIADLLGHTTTRMVDQHYRHRLRDVVSVAADSDWTASSK